MATLSLLGFVMVNVMTAAACRGDTDFSDLLRRLPDDANTLIVINLDQIFASPAAVAENWKAKFTDANESQPLVLPPTAKRFVMAAEFDLEHMMPQWQAAVMELSVDPAPADLAERLQGKIESISDVEAVWLPSNAYIVKFAPKIFGMMSPARRRALAKWVRLATGEADNELSPYLREAAGYAEQAGTEIIMAIDLRDIISPEVIREAVEKSTFLKDYDADEVAAALASIRGTTLGVKFGKQASGKLKLDFGESVEVLKPVARELLLNVLGNAGAMLNEFESWQFAVEGKQLSIAGPVTASGLQRLFSLLTLDTAIVEQRNLIAPEPAPGAEERQPQADASGKGFSRTALSTRQYFRSLGRYVDDIRRAENEQSLSHAALWIESYANRVERLRTYQVDPEMVSFAQSIATQMHQMVAEIHGIAQRTQSRSAGVVPQVEARAGVMPYSYGWRRPYINYGGYRVPTYAPFVYASVDYGSAINERRRITSEELTQGMQNARDIFAGIVSDMQQMQAKMSQRYNLEF